MSGKKIIQTLNDFFYLMSQVSKHQTNYYRYSKTLAAITMASSVSSFSLCKFERRKHTFNIHSGCF